ncbi:unnamed protein product [Heligmosomoides polygyrus]|uniref:Annexin n=1 Tax=Heligmosomoides polygyrus TaxID=6339 RepID=A0A183GLF5_HELPZ|nr:unnamed protein product [Heligmosomoides polygyrus]
MQASLLQVVEDTSGEFRRILSSLISGVRDDDDHTDDQRAREDAARLYSNDEGKLTPKSDPDYFHHVVLTSNQHQLKKMCDAYAELSGMNIEKQIEKEFSGDVRNAYLTIVRLAANRQKYFATQLYGCMSGPGTRDNDLIRTLVTRSEVDLELIKEEFRELYGDVLDRMIKTPYNEDRAYTLFITLLFLLISTYHITSQWKTSRTALLYRGVHDISNNRPIYLMYLVYKLFTRANLNRIGRTLDEGEPCERAAFRRFSMIDHIHTITKLIEVSREYMLLLCPTFIDLKKAFESVETEAVIEGL